MNRFKTSTLPFDADFDLLVPSAMSSAEVQSRGRSVQLRDYLGAAWLLCASATSPLAEPWLPNRYHETATVIIRRAPLRRRLSLREARLLALDVLDQAERRRLHFAQEEAERAWRFEVEA